MAALLTIIFWSTTYLLIIYHGYRSWQQKPLLMPLLSCCLNFGWEIIALVQSRGFWGFIIWMLLDIAIVIMNVHHINTGKMKMAYLISILLSILSCWFFFRFPNIDGKFISVYAIDLIMAIEYLAVIKQISPHGKMPVAITKLLGDFFAWICNIHYMKFIAVTGFAVLLLNLLYLYLCIKEARNSLNMKS